MKNESEEIPAEVVEEIRETFDLYDKSGNGYIKPEDLDNVLKRIGENLDPLELSKLAQAMDPHSRRQIFFADFLREISPKLQKSSLRKTLVEAFRVFDRERTGYISGSELMIILTNLLDDLKFTPIQVAILVKTADTDGDGQINYEEFANIMLNAIFSNGE
eukprot:TRINITY_DN5730_c0_g2_i5.p1 TRINITY_DN5730_c0_g2~~TRINITY_DN5730_c0_g2_i5.p1  ORF type:complete len:161 (+),score=50.52 TRINITY_DN5730_c0_g2_i5:52-534(+)